MAIVKLARVRLHPWIWWTIVRRAVDSYLSGRGEESLSLANRRRIAVIMKTMDDALDPDDVILECPYVRLSRAETTERARSNAKLAELAESDGGPPAEQRNGYRPLPKPHLEVSIDFRRDDLTVIRNAVEAFAATPALTHTFSQGFVIAADAIAAAKDVEIDTNSVQA